VHGESVTLNMVAEVGVFVNMMKKESDLLADDFILLSSRGEVVNPMEPVSLYAHSYDVRLF